MIERSSPDVGYIDKGMFDYLGSSQIVRAGGLMHFSGIVSARPDGSCHAPGDMEAQVRHVLTMFRKLMEHENLGMDRVVATTTFTTRMDELSRCIPLFKEVFGDHPPTSTWIGVERLGSADYLLEFVPVVLA